MDKDWVLLLTCEHAGYRIPKAYRNSIDSETEALLPTHRGWDRGALALAKIISKAENAPLFFTETSRLLIDCNRSLSHPTCLGPNFRGLPSDAKEQIAQDYYHPYRLSVVESIQRLHSQGQRVLHCAFHSFTPELDGVVRNAELGLLYDPARQSESFWADRMAKELLHQRFPWRVRRNYPYRGKSDGFTRFLRKTFADADYGGFEIEVNQSLVQRQVDFDSIAKELMKLFGALPLQRSNQTSSLSQS